MLTVALLSEVKTSSCKQQNGENQLPSMLRTHNESLSARFLHVFHQSLSSAPWRERDVDTVNSNAAVESDIIQPRYTVDVQL